MRTASMSLVASCLLAACQPAATPNGAQSASGAEADSARAEITASMHKLSQWLSSGQPDSAATLLTDDYQAMAANQPTVAGKAKWLEWTRQMVAQARITTEPTSESIEVSGPLAVQRGRYTNTFQSRATTKGASTTVTEIGKLLWHWRKVDGHWRLATAAWSSDAPSKQ